MSRSVSTPPNAVVRVYLNISDIEDSWEFASWIERLRDLVTETLPEFQECNYFCNREDHVILEAQAASVTVSEYNGIAAVCLTQNSPYDAYAVRVADTFCKLIEEAHPYSVLRKLGTFSNGEAIFQLANQPDSCVSSKEGQLW
jgi:hypothetical protein